MFSDALTAVVTALEGQGLRVATRSGDITPPVAYVEFGSAGETGIALEGGRIPLFWVFWIPVRGVSNLTGDMAALDLIWAALEPLAMSELTAVRSSVTVNTDTWPGIRTDVTVLALTLAEV